MAAVAVGGILALTVGCAPQQPAPSSLVGKTLEDSQDGLPGSLVIVDLTPNVVHQPPAYNGGEDPSRWSVIAACRSSDDQGYILGVVPRGDATSQVNIDAKKGVYTSLLIGCKK
ncbi:hypothetical protein [uncultured Microbacterium sp.]|uniref:hypothetical protein n=1 Tax=uncultured Microbacterium sp. TaxID=191216 RepID=UPI0025FB008D|nr:hypothetical protein [uncultured Microbacterium sp.]